VWVELRTANPVVNLRVFKDRAFTSGSIIMFYGFFSLFAGLVLLPIYLQNLMGYTAFWAGVVLGPGGLASFFIMPVAAALMRKGVSPRVLLTMGLSILAYSLWLMSRFNLEASFAVVASPRVVMGFGLGLFFVPLTTATFANIPREEMGNASGLFNLLRNLGGSFGVAFIATVLARRSQTHQNFLAEHVTPYNPEFQYSYEQLRQWLELHRPDLALGDGPLVLLAREVARQAAMMAFNDSFWMLAWIAASMLPLVFLLKRSGDGLAPGPAH
jgi:DHA2 family multidrug resistance protein